MSDAGLRCRDGGRRRLLAAGDWNGIDFVEVFPDQVTLCVHFFGPVPEGLEPRHLVVEGGRRVTGIRVVSVARQPAREPERPDECLRVIVDRPGDFSTYRLCLRGSGGPLSRIDPRHSCAEFRFKVDCPTELDCLAEPACREEERAPPQIDYLARDYESFRRLMLDRMALLAPDWRERHAADVGVTLVEALAHVADHLAYWQDAVGTEAYLETARRRVSVRRHARLVDYPVHEGCNARAFVTVGVQADVGPLAASDLCFVTDVPRLALSSGRVARGDDLAVFPESASEVFEPLLPGPGERLQFRKAHGAIALHTWGEDECCLSRGATGATLADPDGSLALTAGEFLVLEEVLGPATGRPEDADPARRHVVRLTAVERGRDPVTGAGVMEVRWGEEDALPFALCLSARLPPPDCRLVTGISVARGNVVLVDHGRSVNEELPGRVEGGVEHGPCACDGAVLEARRVPEPFRAELARSPLVFAEPVAAGASAAALGGRDPRRALPAVRLGSHGSGPDQGWSPVPDLLSSGPDDRAFVVEVDDGAVARLRFGDGLLGHMPEVGTRFTASYRVGGGRSGNVGRETIRTLVWRRGRLDAPGIEPRNPLPASGGVDPEPTEEVRLRAPEALRHRLERAVTAADYAELALREPRLQRAAAVLRWTGSWYEARVAADPLGAEELAEELRVGLEGLLERYRRMGHDLAVVPVRYVPLDLRLHVCAGPLHERGAVRAALLDLFGSGIRADGSKGYFHPDNLTCGEGVAVSRIAAAAQAVPGVTAVEVARLERLGGPPGTALADGILWLAPWEVARLDSDPSYPEHGVLALEIGGGR